jgi:L-arabinokinase
VPTLVAYVSGHGFGHASRTIELLNAIAERAPDVRIAVRTAVVPWLFAATARPGISVTAVECDTGAVQIDSLRLDEVETVRRARQFMATFDDRVAAEAAAIVREDAALVIADVPPLGIAAGRAAGRPTALVGNFTWDWIYAAYPGGAALADAIGRVYAAADVVLRLPLHGGFATCRNIRDLPFIARRSRRDPLEVRRALGLPDDRPLALVSFGGYGVDALDLGALAGTAGYGIVMTGTTMVDGATLQSRGSCGALVPLDEPGMYARGFRYEDVVKAVDAVVTKPGYGIIAECLANDTALLYTSRGHFAEYDVLVAGMPRYLRARYLDRDTLLAGHWGPSLDALLAQTGPPERAAVNGADVAAELLLDVLKGQSH